MAFPFIDPEQWDIVIETMAASIPESEQLKVFEKLRKIAIKMVKKDDPRYRTLFLNNGKLQRSVLVYDGGLEFLFNLGFIPEGGDSKKLVCSEVNTRVIEACLLCLDDKIESLRDFDTQMYDRQPSLSVDEFHTAPIAAAVEGFYDTVAVKQSAMAQSLESGSSIISPKKKAPPRIGRVAVAKKRKEVFGSTLHRGDPFVRTGLTRQRRGAAGESGRMLLEKSATGAQLSDGPSHVLAQASVSKLSHMLGEAEATVSKSAAATSPTADRCPGAASPTEALSPLSESSSAIAGIQRMDSKMKLGKVLGGSTYIWKVFVFIRHGNSIWNSSKAGGRLKKYEAVAKGLLEYWKSRDGGDAHADSRVVDAPLSNVGIRQAYDLSSFLSRHFLLRQFERLQMLERQRKVLDPISSALAVLSTDILGSAVESAALSEDVRGKLEHIYTQLTEAQCSLKKWMLEKRANGQGHDGADDMEDRSSSMTPGKTVPLPICAISPKKHSAAAIGSSMHLEGSGHITGAKSPVSVLKSRTSSAFFVPPTIEESLAVGSGTAVMKKKSAMAKRMPAVGELAIGGDVAKDFSLEEAEKQSSLLLMGTDECEDVAVVVDDSIEDLSAEDYEFLVWQQLQRKELEVAQRTPMPRYASIALEHGLTSFESSRSREKQKQAGLLSILKAEAFDADGAFESGGLIDSAPLLPSEKMRDEEKVGVVSDLHYFVESDSERKEDALLESGIPVEVMPVLTGPKVGADVAGVDADSSRAFAHVVDMDGMGLGQTKESEMPLEMDWLLDELIDSSTSVVTCSNLRRAISTAIIGLWDRFGASEEKIYILPFLQELGMNVDAHTPVVESSVPQISTVESRSSLLDAETLANFYRTRLEVGKTVGYKKSLLESTEQSENRMRCFLEWAFTETHKRTVVAVGHSHWFRHFFKTFLPPEAKTHVSRKKKIQNCGAVAFRMCCEIRDDRHHHFTIQPGSITSVYKGFFP